MVREHAMTDMTPIAAEAAARLAFSLMRSAYLDLAQTLLRMEEGPARALLQGVEHRIAYRLGYLGEGIPEDAPQKTAIATAAGRVRAVLREAQAT
ncbi:hypothetical protein ACFPYM_25090 [Methylobacterium hispanicum]